MSSEFKFILFGSVPGKSSFSMLERLLDKNSSRDLGKSLKPLTSRREVKPASKREGTAGTSSYVDSLYHMLIACWQTEDAALPCKVVPGPDMPPKAIAKKFRHSECVIDTRIIMMTHRMSIVEQIMPNTVKSAVCILPLALFCCKTEPSMMSLGLLVIPECAFT